MLPIWSVLRHEGGTGTGGKGCAHIIIVSGEVSYGVRDGQLQDAQIFPCVAACLVCFLCPYGHTSALLSYRTNTNELYWQINLATAERWNCQCLREWRKWMFLYREYTIMLDSLAVTIRRRPFSRQLRLVADGSCTMVVCDRDHEATADVIIRQTVCECECESRQPSYSPKPNYRYECYEHTEYTEYGVLRILEYIPYV